MPASIISQARGNFDSYQPAYGREKYSPVDTRTDEEILREISNPPVVTSERNVWAWWDLGIANMRPWCQRNVAGWVKILGQSWTVRVLDNQEGSPSHWRRFLNTSNLPECLAQKTLHGDHARTISSDMIRLPCLAEHGGVWMDVGIILLMDLDNMCWRRLYVSLSGYQVALVSTNELDPWAHFGNFFIAARKQNPLIQRWMRVYLEAWKNRSNCQGLSNHPLFDPLLSSMDKEIDMGVSDDYTLDYFTHMLALDRVLQLQDPTDGFNGQDYCRNHVMLMKYNECAGTGMLTNNDSIKQFRLLSTQCEERADLPELKEARRLCEHLLTQTAMIKLYHRRIKVEDQPTLAELWDCTEYQNADNEPGTFAAYLRYHSTHYIQSRTILPAKFTATTDFAIVAGLLEAD